MPGLNWIETSSLPAAKFLPGFLVTQTNAYCIGGMTSGSATGTVYSATRNQTTGAINAWSTSTSTIPARYDLIVLEGRQQNLGLDYLYCFGGINVAGTIQNTIPRSRIISGAIQETSGWATSGSFLDSGALPLRRNFSAVYTSANNGVFCFIGGINETGTYLRSIGRLRIDSLSGAALTTSGLTSGDINVEDCLPVNGRAYTSLVTLAGTGSYLYLVGGRTSAAYTAPILSFSGSEVAAGAISFTASTGSMYQQNSTDVITGAVGYGFMYKIFAFGAEGYGQAISYAPTASTRPTSYEAIKMAQANPCGVQGCRVSYYDKFIYLQAGSQVWYADMTRTVEFAGARVAGGFGIGHSF